jgi:hypothetical protein
VVDSVDHWRYQQRHLLASLAMYVLQALQVFIKI